MSLRIGDLKGQLLKRENNQSINLKKKKRNAIVKGGMTGFSRRVWIRNSTLTD